MQFDWRKMLDCAEITTCVVSEASDAYHVWYYIDYNARSNYSGRNSGMIQQYTSLWWIFAV